MNASATTETTVVVKNRNGLHARPSSVLAETALQFSDTTIVIRKGEFEVDAKSIMELLLLEAGCGSELQIAASGPAADEAVRKLTDLFAREFDLNL